MKRPANSEIEAARKRIREMEAERERASVDLATFNENIRATEYKRASLRHHNAVNEYNGKRRELENELARYKMKTDEAWEAYAQASCLALANVVQSRLPRELRDVIYSYIWDVDARPSAYKVQCYYTCTCKDDPPCVHWKRAPHYVKPDYTGKEISMEIIEFLESDRLKKVAIYEVKTLNKILGEDLFQSGKPAVRYIRRMELFLDLYDYTNPCASQPSEIPCPQDLRRLKRDIFPLLEVPGGQRFTLDIILQGSIELVHMNLVERILEVIRPAYLTLTRSGATVTINYVIFQVARISLDEFYNAPDDWRMRFQEELGKVGWRNLKKKFSFS